MGHPLTPDGVMTLLRPQSAQMNLKKRAPAEALLDSGQSPVHQVDLQAVGRNLVSIVPPKQLQVTPPSAVAKVIVWPEARVPAFIVTVNVPAG
jgi:hypothetical protein